MFNTILLTIVSLLGALYDWRARRIPNWLTFGTFFLMLFISLISLKFIVVADCVIGFFVGIALLIVPYAIGWMGAGDVKLLGAVGAIVGFKYVILIFVYSTLWGLVCGLLWIILRPGHLKFLITTAQVLPAIDKTQKFPYGVVIFLGTISYIMAGAKPLLKLGISLPIWQ